MAKSLDDNFRDWEAHVFGFGYGTGQRPVLTALRSFLELCVAKGGYPGYHYENLEEKLTPTVTWLLINVLCNADIIEYGTSARYGWLSEKGRKLQEFVLSKSVDELCDITGWDDDSIHCFPDACNCSPEGYRAGVVCDNPFWESK